MSLTEDEKQLIAEAELGEEARKFLEGDLFRFMVGVANQEVNAALDGLETVSPTDTAKILELQTQVKFGRGFESWLRDLVHRGDQALVIWQENRKDN